MGRRSLTRARRLRLVPPDAGGHDGELAEDVGVVEAEGEGDEAAERGAAEGGVLRAGEGAEAAVDEGLELFDEEAAVAAAFAAAEADVAGGGVLGHAADAGVGDADEDDGLDEAFAGEGVGGGVGAPGAVDDVGGAAVEEVLAVVEVEDGEAAAGLRRDRLRGGRRRCRGRRRGSASGSCGGRGSAGCCRARARGWSRRRWCDLRQRSRSADRRYRGTKRTSESKVECAAESSTMLQVQIRLRVKSGTQPAV